MNLEHRTWKAVRCDSYRKTYRLNPGESWWDSEITTKQWETLVEADEGPIPVGAMIARELEEMGAAWAAFTEMWAGRRVLVGPDLICLAEDGSIAVLLAELERLNAGSLGGLPDVVGQWPDGRIILREAKCRATKDSPKANQAQDEHSCDDGQDRACRRSVARI